MVAQGVWRTTVGASVHIHSAVSPPALLLARVVDSQELMRPSVHHHAHTSALLSALRSRLWRNTTDLTGQRHCVAPTAFACTPPVGSTLPASRDRGKSAKGRHACLGVPANAACEPPEGNGLLVLQDVPKELLGLLQRHALDGLGRLAGVLPRQKIHNACALNSDTGRPWRAGEVQQKVVRSHTLK